MSEQYATDVNLRARIDLHQRFSTATQDWHRWLFDRVALPAGSRVLEAGCGPAEFWKRNLDRLDPSWQLTLSDRSPGMIDVARAVLGDRADYVVADIEDLPFDGETFDVVMAHHMLYHVPDRPRAFAEIRRVLVSGGVFHAATNGDGHLQEMGELSAGWWPFARHVDAFGLESGPPQLEPFFADVRVERCVDDLEITDVEPVLAYLRSSERYDGRELEDERAAVEAAIARDGVFFVRKSGGLISCRKP
ncbi:MAG TPA: class I SAM-dependent methyltransferase [Gaiellaceae bacterium]|nr:class I SAM-dependent methyltransferase [Gaiellaceae bacterium]